MTTYKALVIAAACLCVQALPQSPPVTKNTIFGDEKLEGQIFEHEDVFTEDLPMLRNADSPYRLPTTTVPVHYNILWNIDMERLVYSGTVEIQLVATEVGVTQIVLHSSHNEILSVVLTQGTTVVPQTFSFEEVYHFLRVQPTTALQYNAQNPVIYTLTINFGAEMRNDMYGIYRSWYRNNATDQISWMASTQFQATAARYAFPCYDEPSFKATFDITIRRPANYRSWCNTRIARTENSTNVGYEDDVYHTTPVMSTYLLALIVAEYSAIEQFNDNGDMIYEVIARPAAIESGQGQYAFDVGQDLLAEMSRHTNVDFYSTNPNMKMTQASIPDFSAGAMENWGLLTYREAYLMYDEQHTNSFYKQLIGYILSHEIAHMWFGNLVTCDWWDVLWLNEGFARYYQYFLTHWVETEMGFETRFITEQMHTALLSDSANNPHPLSNPTGVGSPGEVSSMFSTLSYNKGAAVIRMTEHLLGFSTQEEGLRRYLRGKSFETAHPIDLFEALQSAAIFTGTIEMYGSDFNVIDYYKTWTEQAGSPVLNVQVNHQTGDMTITQRRFNINSGYSDVSTNWIIPITFATPGNANFSDTKPTHIIRDSVTVINRGSIGDQWVVLNKQQTGYYRVNYDDYTWNLIILALRDQNVIHEYNKAQIVDDVFQFARSGLMSYSRAFTILSFLETETSYAPWVAAVTGFTWLRNRYAGTQYIGDLQNLIAQWATTVISDLTYYPTNNESFMRSYLRYQLAPTMCAINVRACRDAANAQFRALVDNGVEVPVDSRVWVYCNGLREGSQADFNFMWNRFQNHNVYTEKITLLQTLGCTPHQQSLYTYLDGIVQENNIVRPQDYTTAFNSAVTGNEANTQIVFQYIQTNLQAIINAFGSASTPLSYISTRLRTEAEIVAFQSWATQNQAALGVWYQTVFNGAESSRQSIQWATANANDISSYMVNGNEEITLSTAAPFTPDETEPIAAPELVEPQSPELPSSATSIFVSISMLGLTAAANLAFA